MTTDKNKSLSDLTDAELLGEFARHRAAKTSGDMTSLELAAEETKSDVGASVLAQALAERCAAEDGKPRRCPKCGGSVVAPGSVHPSGVRYEALGA